MSARTKVMGNRAIRCDAPDCDAVFVGYSWLNKAQEVVSQAAARGWTRSRRRLDPHPNKFESFDACPAHAEHQNGGA